MGAEPSTRSELDEAESRLLELQQADCLPNSIPGIKKSEAVVYQAVFQNWWMFAGPLGLQKKP